MTENLSGLADEHGTVRRRMLLEDVQAAIDTLKADVSFGPYVLYVPRPSGFKTYTTTAWLRRALRDPSVDGTTKRLAYAELVDRRRMH